MGSLFSRPSPATVIRVIEPAPAPALPPNLPPITPLPAQLPPPLPPPAPDPLPPLPPVQPAPLPRIPYQPPPPASFTVVTPDGTRVSGGADVLSAVSRAPSAPITSGTGAGSSPFGSGPAPSVAPKPAPVPAPIPAVPLDDDLDDEEAQIADLLRRQRGLTGTIKTSFTGVLSQSDLVPQRKTLLGE